MKNVFGTKTLAALALVTLLGACDAEMMNAQNAAAGNENGAWEQYEISTNPVIATLPVEYREQFDCKVDDMNPKIYYCVPKTEGMDLLAIASAVDSYIHRTYGVMAAPNDGSMTNTKLPRASADRRSPPVTLGQGNQKVVMAIGIVIHDASVTFNPDAK
jgi:hypothetical protein